MVLDFFMPTTIFFHISWPYMFDFSNYGHQNIVTLETHAWLLKWLQLFIRYVYELFDLSTVIVFVILC